MPVPDMVSFKYKNLTFIEPNFTVQMKAPNGVVGYWMRERTKVAIFKAKAQVGKDTGALERSITYEQRMVRNGNEVSIFSNNKIALIHHQGTKPHLIEPKNSSALVFIGRRTHSRVVTNLVRHPGTKPNRYLTDQLSVFRRGLLPL